MGNTKSFSLKKCAKDAGFKQENNITNQIYSIIQDGIRAIDHQKVETFLKHYQCKITSSTIILLLHSINENTNLQSLKKVFHLLIDFDKTIINKISDSTILYYYFTIDNDRYRMMENDVLKKDRSFIDILYNIKSELNNRISSERHVKNFNGDRRVVSIDNDQVYVPLNDFYQQRDKHKLNIVKCIDVLIQETEKQIINIAKIELKVSAKNCSVIKQEDDILLPLEFIF